MKKPLIAIAGVLAAVCAVTASGCRNGNSKNLAVLSSNWYSGTGYNGIQPTIRKGHADFSETVGAEKITYAVTHEPLEEKYRNKVYSVSYDTETAFYTTEFYADTFSIDGKNFPEEYKNGYNKAGEIIAYYYRTELFIPSVTFTLKTNPEKSETFSEGESIVTESWFLSVKDYLRPLYSRQDVKSVTPNMLQPNQLTDGNAFKIYDVSYENFYSYDGKAVTTVTTDRLAQNKEPVTGDEVRLDKSKNTLFDLNSMDIVARANNLSAGSSLSQAISLYIPKSGTVENFNFAGATTPLLSDTEKNKSLNAELAGILEDNGLFTPPVQTEENKDALALQTVAVTVNYNSAQPGGSQTYWFAAINNARNNQGRATMLRYSQPISYNLGTLSYTLKKIDSNLWNK